MTISQNFLIVIFPQFFLVNFAKKLCKMFGVAVGVSCFYADSCIKVTWFKGNYNLFRNGVATLQQKWLNLDVQLKFSTEKKSHFFLFKILDY